MEPFRNLRFLACTYPRGKLLRRMKGAVMRVIRSCAYSGVLGLADRGHYLRIIIRLHRELIWASTFAVCEVAGGLQQEATVDDIRSLGLRPR